MLRAGLAAITLAAMAAAWTAGGARADTNIALGKMVSIVATDPDPSAGFNNGTAGNLQNITNGIILPDATAYGSAAAAPKRSNGTARATSSRSRSGDPTPSRA